MFNWLTGGGGAPAAEVLNTARPQTPPQNSKQATVEEVYEDVPPETPAALFAVKAFRTAIFGTPAPPPRQTRIVRTTVTNTADLATSKPVEDGKQRITELPEDKKEEKATTRRGGYRRSEQRLDDTTTKPVLSRRQKLTTQEQKDDDDDVCKPIPFKLASHQNLFEPNSKQSSELPAYLAQGTPVRPSSPTKGILKTPGAMGPGRKNGVTFDSATKQEEEKTKNGRIRSGLPGDFPGKFPSPWTPRNGTPRRKFSGSLEETSLPIGSAPKSGPGRYEFKYEVTEDSRIEDILKDIMNESEDETNTPVLQQGDLTMDINAPKSASGKYWKEHAEELEGVAVEKVNRLKERMQKAIDYAKRKDEFCVNLSEKIRELLEKNKLLKNEVKRLNKFTSSPEGSALSDAMHMLAEKEARISASEDEMAQMQLQIDQLAAKASSYGEMLDQREHQITDLSMSLYGGEHVDPEESGKVLELRQKLRKAREELKELGPLRSEFRNAKSRISILEKEKKNLEDQLERMKSVGDDTAINRSSIRSTTENRLRTRIDELEKEKRDLKAEMRTKAAEVSKERREAEKALRAEISALKSKLTGEEFDRKELESERERLKRVITELETKTDSGDMGPSTNPNDWQQKHRTILEELRGAREEAAALRQQIQQSKLAPPPRPRVYGTVTEQHEKEALPSNPSEITSKGPGSDDSAIDRSFDHIPSAPPNFADPPIQDIPDFGDLPSQDIPNFADPPTHDLSLYDQPQSTPRANKENNKFTNSIDFNTPPPALSESFASMRRQKASPRPSVVNWESSPKRRAFPVGRRTSSVGAVKAASGGAGMDEARRAAAAERVAKRRAERKAAAGK